MRSSILPPKNPTKMLIFPEHLHETPMGNIQKKRAPLRKPPRVHPSGAAWRFQRVQRSFLGEFLDISGGKTWETHANDWGFVVKFDVFFQKNPRRWFHWEMEISKNTTENIDGNVTWFHPQTLGWNIESLIIMIASIKLGGGCLGLGIGINKIRYDTSVPPTIGFYICKVSG